MALRKHSECRQGLRVRLKDMIKYSQKFLKYKCYCTSFIILITARKHRGQHSEIPLLRHLINKLSNTKISIVMNYPQILVPPGI